MRTGLVSAGVLAALAMLAVVVGSRVSGALEEISELASSAGVETSRAPSPVQTGIAASVSELEAVAVANAPAEEAPAAQEAAVPTDPAVFGEQELQLDYFGDRLSLNDLGQLTTPDPEFDRAVRALANEFGEIEPAE